MEKRYYYKKDGKPAYNIKEPLENILEDTTGYEEITKEEWDELTYVAPYVPSEKELAKQAKQREIAEKKQFLQATDYVVIKIAECDNEEEALALRQEYADVIAERKKARAEINKLYEELEGE